MAKVRRLFVPTLESAAPGGEFVLPESEARHARVLRLQPGDSIELGDSTGRIAAATILPYPAGEIRVSIESIQNTPASSALRVTLGVAWPKGKRAAFMVEKCAELGVHALVPILFERGTVQKDEESEGVSRLRRIAAEASKQCGRPGVMEVAAEESLSEFMKRQPSSMTVLLDPRGSVELAEHLLKARAQQISLIVGPEGGLSAAEHAAIEAAGIPGVKLAGHILRIETAAIGAAAVCEALGRVQAG